MNVMPFNFLDIEAVANPQLFPPGDYILEIKKVEQRRRPGEERPRLFMDNSIVLGPWASEEHVGESLRTSVPLSPVGVKFLDRLFVACGFTKEMREKVGGELNQEWLVGKQYVASVFKHGNRMLTAAERPLKPEPPKTTVRKESEVPKGAALRDKAKQFLSRLQKACKQFLKVLREG